MPLSLQVVDTQDESTTLSIKDTGGSGQVRIANQSAQTGSILIGHPDSSAAVVLDAGSSVVSARGASFEHANTVVAETPASTLAMYETHAGNININTGNTVDNNNVALTVGRRNGSRLDLNGKSVRLTSDGDIWLRPNVADGGFVPVGINGGDDDCMIRLNTASVDKSLDMNANITSGSSIVARGGGHALSMSSTGNMLVESTGGTGTVRSSGNMFVRATAGTGIVSSSGDMLVESTGGTGTVRSPGNMLVQATAGTGIVRSSGNMVIDSTGGTTMVQGTNWTPHTQIFDANMEDESGNSPGYSANGRRAHYAQCMNIVHYSARFAWSNKTDPVATEAVRFTVPKTIKDEYFNASMGHAVSTNVNITGHLYCRTLYGPNQTMAELRYTVPGVSDAAVLWSDLDSVGTVVISLTYMVE